MTVSIITVTYNVSKKIIQTLESVKEIYNTDIEYIIIDGGSTDDTLSIINEYKDIVDVLISKPDKGIYDAMNKGIDIATGDWIININCGDIIEYIPFEVLNENLDCYAICGRTIDENGNVFITQYNKMMEYNNHLPHQGMFYRRKTMRHYNIKYKIFGDYDLNLGLYKENKKVLIINDIIAIHNLDGVSMNKKYIRELYQVVRSNLGYWAMIRLFLYYRMDGIKKRIFKWNSL